MQSQEAQTASEVSSHHCKNLQRVADSEQCVDLWEKVCNRAGAGKTEQIKDEVDCIE